MQHVRVLVGVLALVVGCERTTTSASAPTASPGSEQEASEQDEPATPQARLRGLTVGTRHACAWTRDGVAVCWGGNRSAQAGRGVRSGPCRPLEIPGLTDVTHMDAAERYTCAVTGDGGVSCFGEHPLGDGDDPTDGMVTWTIEGGAVAVATTSGYACARATDGEVWCWGRRLPASPDGPGSVVDPRRAPELGPATGLVDPPPPPSGEELAGLALPELPAGVGLRDLALVTHPTPGALAGCLLRDDDGVACWDTEGAPLWADELAALSRGAWATELPRACRGIDRDDDGKPDAEDRCPSEPETYNGRADDDGCPDPPESLVRLDVRAERFELKQKVKFEIGKDRIRPESFELLIHLAAAINGNPRIARIQIEGHTDSRSNEHLYGRRPTRDRAERVREFLITRGVDPARLEAQGYGEDEPIADNRTAEGRALNRRIEVTIRAWAD